MAYFSISFTDDPVPNVDEVGRSSMGLIQIDDHQESFVTSLEFWDRDDYERSWRAALLRIVKNEGSAALITSLRDPMKSNIVRWWPMYRNRGDDRVFFQEHLLFLSELHRPFDLECPYEHVMPRSSTDEKGCKVSEWITSVSALEKFLR